MRDPGLAGAGVTCFLSLRKTHPSAESLLGADADESLMIRAKGRVDS
jgi:hypothetical protein